MMVGRRRTPEERRARREARVEERVHLVLRLWRKHYASGTSQIAAVLFRRGPTAESWAFVDAVEEGGAGVDDAVVALRARAEARGEELPERVAELATIAGSPSEIREYLCMGKDRHERLKRGRSA